MAEFCTVIRHAVYPSGGMGAHGLMSDDCGLLVFEVTAGRILPLPIANQQS
jgi:hypothetical protein